MADQPKKKSPSQTNRNTDRRNGKAFKTKPDTKFRGKGEYRGSRTTGVRLTELDKVLLGGGAMRRIARRIPGSVDR